jgi:hypothetical protein
MHFMELLYGDDICYLEEKSVLDPSIAEGGGMKRPLTESVAKHTYQYSF